MRSNLIQKQVWSNEQPIRVELLETHTIPDGATLNRGLWISPDEVNMYLISYASRRIDWYKMTTPGAMATKVFQSSTALPSSVNLESIWMNDAGTILIVSLLTGQLLKFNLATPWNPATYFGSTSIPFSYDQVFSMQFSQNGYRSIISTILGVYEQAYSSPFGGTVTTGSVYSTGVFLNGLAVWQQRKVAVDVYGTFYRLKGELQFPLSKINDTSGIEAMSPFFGCFPTGTRNYYQKRKGSTNIVIKKYKIL